MGFWFECERRNMETRETSDSLNTSDFTLLLQVSSEGQFEVNDTILVPQLLDPEDKTQSMS